MSRIFARAVSVFMCLVVSSAGTVTHGRAVDDPDWNFAELRKLNPALDEFVRGHRPVSLDGLFEASELDEDPWFMRGQAFVDPLLREPPQDQTAFLSENRSMTVQVPGTLRALRIDQPLAPAFELQNFIFLRSTEPQLFAGRLRDGGISEGLFFIDTDLVRAELGRAGERHAVPVFFLPLAGSWSQPIEHVFDSSTQTLTLNNRAGHAASLGLDTLKELTRKLSLNVALALVTRLKHDPAASAVMRERASSLLTGGALHLPEALPARGSTFGFGTVFTGVDLDQPSRGLFRARARYGNLFRWWPEAHAGLTPDVLDSIITSLTIYSSLWVVSTFAQFTILRERLKERRRAMEARQPPGGPEILKGRVGRALKDNADVYTNALTVLSNGILAGAGYVLEYAFDRSGVRVAQSGWLRRLLDNTYLYPRMQIDEINLTAREGFFGIGIGGGIDMTFMLGFLYASPFVFPWVAGFFSSARQQKVAAEYSGTNAIGNGRMVSEVAFYLQSLPQYGSAYVSTITNSLIERIKPDVRAQFVAQGKNPLDFEAEVRAETKRRVALLLVERKSPLPDQFLFSAPSIARSIAAWLGYRVPAADVVQSKDFDLGGPPQFRLSEARWGLAPHVIRKVHARLIDLARHFPDDPNVAEAVTLAQETSRRFYTFTRIAGDPAHAGQHWREGRWARRLITLLSIRESGLTAAGLPFIDAWKPEDLNALDRLIAIEQKVDGVAARAGRSLNRAERKKRVRKRAAREDRALVIALDDIHWRGVDLKTRRAAVEAEAQSGLLGAAVRNERAATLFGTMFRETLDGLENGRDQSPTAADVAEFGTAARAEARALLAAAPDRVGFGEVDILIETLALIKRKAAAREEARLHATWRPSPGDWLERRQIARAHRAAAAATGEGAPTEDPRVRTLYKETFRRALSREMGLHPIEDPEYPDEAQVTAVAVEAAEHQLQGELNTNPNWRAYLSTLDAGEELRFLAHQYGTTFLSKYTELTVSRSAMIPLNSPGQPGFFQRARQMKFARPDSTFGRAVTYALRVGDSLFDSSANRPGVKEWIKRRVPFAQDVMIDFDLRKRNLLPFLTVTWPLLSLYGAHFNFPTALFFYLTGGMTDVAHWWVDRGLMNVGVPPLAGIGSQVKYATILSGITYFTTIPFFFFVGDFEKLFYATTKACQTLLTGRGATKP